MSMFITRVELYGTASWQDYEKLHGEMERHGFSRTITSDKGTVYNLPTATYYRNSSSPRSSILEDAKRAANTVWSDNGVLVSETNGNMWDGLREHTKRRLA